MVVVVILERRRPSSTCAGSYRPDRRRHYIDIGIPGEPLVRGEAVDRLVESPESHRWIEWRRERGRGCRAGCQPAVAGEDGLGRLKETRIDARLCSTEKACAPNHGRYTTAVGALSAKSLGFLGSTKT